MQQVYRSVATGSTVYRYDGGYQVEHTNSKIECFGTKQEALTCACEGAAMTKQSLQAKAKANLAKANKLAKAKMRKAMQSLAMSDLNRLRHAPYGVSVPLVHEYNNLGRVWA